LIEQLRCGDPVAREAAARQIWERYFHALLGLARNHLAQRVRRREDEEDVLQSMYKSFCLRQQRGDFDLAGRDQLWSLLVQITLCKVRNAAARHRQAKRDVTRELVPPRDDPEAARWAMEQMETSGPTPEEAAVLNEALELRLQALPDVELRQIALRKLEGWSNREIADCKGCTERTVERKLERIRARWTADV
jgi:RNA polymerase sigma factor (sigma-70 family)